MGIPTSQHQPTVSPVIFFSPVMEVTRRRATLDDANVLLELINTAYKHEGKWKVDDRRTNASELSRLLPDQNVDPDGGDYQVMMVIVANEGEDLSKLPEVVLQRRIVGHVRYVALPRPSEPFPAVADLVCRISCLSRVEQK